MGILKTIFSLDRTARLQGALTTHIYGKSNLKAFLAHRCLKGSVSRWTPLDVSGCIQFKVLQRQFTLTFALGGLDLTRFDKAKAWAYSWAIERGASNKYAVSVGAYYANYRVFEGQSQSLALSNAVAMANYIHSAGAK